LVRHDDVIRSQISPLSLPLFSPPFSPSDDGGESVHNEVDEMNEKMRIVAEKLNLKGHMAGMGTQKKFIYGPTDIEVRRKRLLFCFLFVFFCFLVVRDR
jgi:hypothetical protein